MVKFYFNICFAGDCDFDNGPCTWVNVRRGDSFDWIVGSGATSTTGTGPVTDHTKENSKGRKPLFKTVLKNSKVIDLSFTKREMRK